MNEERARNWPLGMTTTSTHDSKRGEDARARIAVLSEMPALWQRAVRRWRDLAPLAFPLEARSLEYLLYQSIVGCWPFGWDGREDRSELVERVQAYALKASREAKQQTSWLAPDAEFETTVERFVRGLFDNEAFIDDARRFVEQLAPYGATNALAASLLRLCSPGIPDTYQGSELWNQSLVDPDNRRPVDYALRRRYLAEIRGASGDPEKLARDLLERFEDGRVKLYVIHRALLERRAQSELFLRGDYERIDAGPNAVAFMRSFEEARLICCVPRLTHRLTGGAAPWALGDVWKKAAFDVPHGGRYRNAFTGATLEVNRGTLQLSDVFHDFPVALLIREPS
jgi:(1->4)-alpha-D-glucan 1-alpha-D-glucosylmutase